MRRADMRARRCRGRDARHRLQIHDLLMIGAVVVHDVEHRNLVMRRRPQRAGHEHEVAVAVEGDREAAMPLVGERRTERGRQRCSRCRRRPSRRSTGRACSMSHSRCGQVLRMALPTSDQSSSLICA